MRRFVLRFVRLAAGFGLIFFEVSANVVVFGVVG